MYIISKVLDFNIGDTLCQVIEKIVGTDGDFVPHARQFDTHQLLQRFFVVREQDAQTMQLF